MDGRFNEVDITQEILDLTRLLNGVVALAASRDLVVQFELKKTGHDGRRVSYPQLVALVARRGFELGR